MGYEALQLVQIDLNKLYVTQYSLFFMACMYLDSTNKHQARSSWHSHCTEQLNMQSMVAWDTTRQNCPRLCHSIQYISRRHILRLVPLLMRSLVTPAALQSSLWRLEYAQHCIELLILLLLLCNLSRRRHDATTIFASWGTSQEALNNSKSLNL